MHTYEINILNTVCMHSDLCYTTYVQLTPEGLPHHFWLTPFFRLSLSGSTHHIWQMAYDPFAHARTHAYLQHTI